MDMDYETFIHTLICSRHPNIMLLGLNPVQKGFVMYLSQKLVELTKEVGYLEQIREGLEDEINDLQGADGCSGIIGNLKLGYSQRVELKHVRIEKLEEKNKELTNRLHLAKLS